MIAGRRSGRGAPFSEREINVMDDNSDGMHGKKPLGKGVMKKTMIVAGLCLAVCAGRAQSLEAFRNKLRSPDARYGSRVEVVEHGAAASAVRAMQAASTGGKIRGYRVRIFFDNSQSARAQAQQTTARFKENYPSIPVYMDYDDPYFKVTVGNCATYEEAVILCGKIKDSFELAFPIRVEIPLSVFAQSSQTKGEEER